MRVRLGLLIGLVCMLVPWARPQDNALDVAGGPADTAAQAPPLPRELRAAWIATVDNIDWPSKPGLPTEQARQELLELVELADKLKLNALVFQVRPHADALYESKLEPWSEYLTGEAGKAPRPAWDPLAFLIEQSHRRGIQVHAWFNPYRAWHPAGKSPVPDNHVKKTMPDAVHQLGEARPDGSAKWLWMDPADPRVQQHTLAVITDVLDRYDLDAIHFDDYFYPYPSYNDGKDFPDDRLWDEYQSSGGELTRGDFRRKAVDDFVQQLSRTIREHKPHVMLGISPFGIYRPGHPHYVKGFDQYEQLYADPYRWLQEGWVDYLAPQLYWEVRNPDQSFVGLLDWWQANNPKGRHIWAGIYTSRLLDETPRYDDAELPAQVRWTRAIGEPSAGHIHFSIKALQRNARGIADAMAKLNDKPALIPASPWMNVPPPEPPEPPEVGKTRAKRVGKTLTVEASKESREQGLQWAVQVRSGDTWQTAVAPASQGAIRLTLPGDADPRSIRVYAFNRAGVASEPTELVE